MLRGDHVDIKNAKTELNGESTLKTSYRGISMKNLNFQGLKRKKRTEL
jgi:hypothetical protein